VDVEQRYKRVEGFEELYHRVVSTVKIGLFIVTINFDGRVYRNNIARVVSVLDSLPYLGNVCVCGWVCVCVCVCVCACVYVCVCLSLSLSLSLFLSLSIYSLKDLRRWS